MGKNIKLEVDNLTVSFKTVNGLVRAVRGVSFDLIEGETLAIVGESGSGKSVTSRTIMGILAGNGVIDDGRIIYEGEDLTKVDEDHFHELRGNKIGMIFQDPMSSLNPIMKIGQQITEGMILNGKHQKNKYKKLIHLEKAAITSIKVKRKTFKLQFKADKLAIKNGESDADLRALKLELKAKCAEEKAKLPAAKAAYKKVKPEARAIVKAEFKAEKARVYEEINALKLESGFEGPDLKEKVAALREGLRRFKRVTRKEAAERAVQAMNEVGIPEPEKRMNQYPFQFSGGMRQRIVIAIALTASPDVLICDEPTTALDVTIQAQILELINDLKREKNLTVIFITHDLGVVANMADRIAVMYAGKIVEIGTAEDIFYKPEHPYTWALMSSMPDLTSKGRLAAIPGTPPNMLFPPKGDAFAARNKFALKIDLEKQPPMFKISETHSAATWLLHKDAPKVDMPEIIKNRIERMTHMTKEVTK